MKKLYRVLPILLMIHHLSFGQVVISMQDFDQVTTMTYTASGGATWTGNSGAGDRPANLAFFTSAITAFGVSNGISSVVFSDNTSLGSYTAKYFEFRLGSWSINSTSNGADAADSVTALVSLDGGTTWSKEIQVGGNNNACWHYSTGTGLAAVTYDGSNTPQLFAPAGGGNRTTDGYSTVRILLPDNCTQARLRIFLRNNHASELWTIDDVTLYGTYIGPVPVLTVLPSTLSGFSYMYGMGPSGSQSYMLSGADLSPISGTLTITAPADYEISSDSLSYSSLLSIPYSGGTLAGVPVWVRLKVGLSVGNYSESVSNAGGGAQVQVVACSGSVTTAPAIYTWVGPDGGNWQTNVNWSPVRSTPAPDDILQFPDGSNKTLSNVPTETIGQLLVLNGTAITLTGTGSPTLTIAGNTGEDLSVAPGCQFNVTGTDPLRILVGPGASGRIHGEMLFDEGVHRLLATDDSSLVFAEGSLFRAGASFSGSAFGNSAANKNTVRFMAGSSYISQGGSNPFGLSYPNSAVIFDHGSLYRHEHSGSLSLSGRTYADFELDCGSTFSPTGSNPCMMDDLTITEGTLNIVLTSPVFTVRGDITVSAGQALQFTPSTALCINLEGTARQVISGEGTLLFNSQTTLTVKNDSGVILDRDEILGGNLDIQQGALTIPPSRTLTVEGITILGDTSCLVLSSDSSATSSFLDQGISGDGTALIERYLAPDTWHFVCIPVTTTTTSVMTGMYATWFNEPENHFQYILDPDSLLSTPGTGYSLYLPDSGIALRYCGIPNHGDVSIAVSRTFVPTGLNDYNGYNLVGNPYPSSLDLSLVVPDWWNVEPAAWFWDPGCGNYRVYISGAESCGTHSRFVPPQQGFFVHCNDPEATPELPGSGTVAFSDAARVHTAEPFLKEGPSTLPLLTVKATGGGTSYYDQLSVYFADIATTGYDPGMDAAKMEGLPEAPEIFTLGQAQRLSVNALPVVWPVTVPMGFTTTEEGSYLLTFSGMDSFDPEVTITLEDITEMYTQDLRAEPAYAFDFSTGESPDRFVLHFTKPNIGLPGVPGVLPYHIFSCGKSIYLSTTSEAPVPAEIMVTDMIGRQVYRGLTEALPLQVIRTRLASGWYLVTLTIDGTMLHEKVYLQ